MRNRKAQAKVAVQDNSLLLVIFAALAVLAGAALTLAG
jgi:hypothetical protein